MTAIQCRVHPGSWYDDVPGSGLSECSRCVEEHGWRRERIATGVLAGLAARSGDGFFGAREDDDAADIAVRFADALIARLDKCS